LLATERRRAALADDLARLERLHAEHTGETEHLRHQTRSLRHEVGVLRTHAENVQQHLAHYQHETRVLQEANIALERRMRLLRYRLVDRVNAQIKKVPLVQGTVKKSLTLSWMMWKGLKSAAYTVPARTVGRLFHRESTDRTAA
jgi:hypothetical protein